MTGVVLPPAGTKTYPFVGNFDGNGKTVSNLTITNNETSLKNAEPPKGAEYSGGVLKQAEIVGFFGVVGCLDDSGEVNNYTYDSSTNQILNMGFDGLNVVSSSSNTLVGLAAGYVNGEIKGVGIKGASIATKEDASAITDVEGVKHISEYSLVGYATEDYRSSLDISDQNVSMPQIDNPNTEHGSTNWGGSVNMKQMYTDLKSEIKSNSISKNVTYVTSETVDVSPEGVESEPYDQVYGSNVFSRGSRYSGNGIYYYRNGQRLDDDGNAIASYGLPYQDLYSDQYIYIYGSYTGTSSSYSKTVTKNQYAYTSKISKNGTYLSVSTSNKTIVSTKNSDEAVSWFMPEAGTSGQISTNIGGTIYYLTYNTSYDLALTTTSGTATWTYDAEKGNLYITYSGSANYYLDYDSSWILTLEATNSYLTIKDVTANMYVGYSGTAEASPAASSKATYSSYAWAYSSSQNAYYPIDSSSVYLGIESTNWAQSAMITAYSGGHGSSTSGRFYLSNASSDGTGTGYILRENFDGTGCTSYLVYADSKWQVSYNTQSGKSSNLPNQRDTFLITKVDSGDYQSNLTVTQTGDMGIGSTTTSTENATATVNPTYFPLAYSYDDPKTKSNITGVSDMNTGYLVGGANYVNGSDYAGDIRVAEYYKLSQLYKAFGDQSSSSSSTYSSSKMQVLTRSTTKAGDGSYSDNGWTKIKDQYNSSSSVSISGFSNSVDSSIFSRYDSARKNLQYTIFNSYSNTTASYSTSLYGLHFMNASISKDHLTEVGKAVVYDAAAEKRYEEDLKKYLKKETTEKPTQKGSVYYNYPVPEDSIDFNLATSGFVTFFGATYYINRSYGTNNSFFSLQEIVRDEDQNITEIKSISKIYANLGDDRKEKPYLYSYDGSVPSGSDSNHMVFDVSWISTNVQMVTYCLYYFEIPVNPGEYALGSVSGKQGSYLLYLDIGTGAADYDSVTIDEKIVSSTYTENFPKGVDFIADLSQSSSVSGGASASIAILAPRKKELEFAISASGDTTTITSSSSEDLQVVYKNAYAEVKGSDGKDITGVFDTPTVVTMERKTVQTFSLTSLTLSMAYSCTWTIENAKEGESLQLYFPSDSATWNVESGDARVSSGLVSFASDGDATIKAEGTGSKTASEDWEGPTPITEESVFSQFQMSISDSSASVEYVYDELSKTYVVTIHCDVAFTVNVTALPSDSDYIIRINDQEITTTGEYSFAANA